MAQPFFQEYFQDDYHKFNRDESASVTIDITVSKLPSFFFFFFFFPFFLLSLYQ
jgi:hypothetical protein